MKFVKQSQSWTAKSFMRTPGQDGGVSRVLQVIVYSKACMQYKQHVTCHWQSLLPTLRLVCTYFATVTFLDVTIDKTRQSEGTF